MTPVSDNGLQFCSKLLNFLCGLLGVRQIAAGSYHPVAWSVPTTQWPKC